MREFENMTSLCGCEILHGDDACLLQERRATSLRRSYAESSTTSLSTGGPLASFSMKCSWGR